MDGVRIEDFYDVTPPQVRLVGGTHAGRRMTVPDPAPFHLALPPRDLDPSGSFTVAMMLGPQLAASPELYCFTGRIDDDGTRVYQLSP